MQPQYEDEHAIETALSPYILRFGVPLAALLATLVSASAFRGPYRWLAERSVAWTDGYSAKFAFVLTLLTFAVLFLLVYGAVGLIALRRGIAPADPRDAQRTEARATILLEVYGRYLLVGGAVLTITCAMGVEALGRADTRTHEIVVGETDAPWLWSMAKVRVSGRLRVDEAVEVIDFGASTYVPLVPTTAARSPIRQVFMRLDETDPEVDEATTSFEGHVGPSLPGLATMLFEQGGLRVDEMLVFTPGAPPDAPLDFGPYTPVGGLVALLGVCLVLAYNRPRLMREARVRFAAIEARFAEADAHDAPERVASDALGLSVSREKLRAIRPDLFVFDDAGTLRRLWLRMTFVRRQTLAKRRFFEFILREGDSRAAMVVVARAPLLVVAAYSDELDAPIMLRFPFDFVASRGWVEGRRLVAAMTYWQGGVLADDITEGPDASGEFSDCFPFIAELVADDLDRIETRVHEIDEDEWSRLRTLADAYLAEHGMAPDRFREGLVHFDTPWSGERTSPMD